jgi:hypothetical protein
MKRMLWLGIGLAVGALAVRAITKRARSFTPGGLAHAAQETAAGMVDSVRTFVDDIRAGMTEREAEIHAALDEGVMLDEDLYPEEGLHHR